MADDYEKHNEAVRYGWYIMYLMTHNLTTTTIHKTIHYITETIHIHTGQLQTLPTPVKKRSSTAERLLELQRRRHDR